MLKGTVLVMALFLLGLAIPVRAQEGSDDSRSSKPAAAQSSNTASPKPVTDDPNYIIGAQDMLDINVWKEPELTRLVPVRPDGKISLPLLNDVQPAQKTPLNVAIDITAALKKFVAD